MMHTYTLLCKLLPIEDFHRDNFREEALVLSEIWVCMSIVHSRKSTCTRDCEELILNSSVV